MSLSCFCSDDHLYVFHDELLNDESAIVLDDEDQDGVLRLGPTESPPVQRMRVQLYNLNYAQVGGARVVSQINMKFHEEI